jgi:hypothetical protein
VLENFVTRWDESLFEFKGDELLGKQKELTQEAVASLGAGDELLNFLGFLSEKGAGDLRDWIIKEGTRGMFSGTEARAAREWVLTIQDENLKVRFLRRIGEEWAGVGLKKFFDALDGSRPCQASLLTGYCCTLAKNDPLGAMRFFKEMCIPKRFNYAQLPEVIAMAPPNSDFVKMAGFFDEDDRPLAKTSRSAVLLNWAGVKPADAAQYVIANTTVVHPDQMGVVIGKWAETAPDAATLWLNKAPAGKPRDEGMAALAQHWTGGDPAKAWQYAAGVGEYDKRVAVATGVFKAWEKVDRAAAEKAWVELFPAQ